MTDLLAPSDITFVFVDAFEIGTWFRKHIGKKSHHRYESVPRNYLHSKAKDWIDEEPIMIWEELDLGSYKDNSIRKRPDLIFEYSNDIWIIEVKHHYCRYSEVFKNPKKKKNAVNQLYQYRNRIQELKWWEGKKIHLAVFWSYSPSRVKNIDLPLTESEYLIWPKDRKEVTTSASIT